MSKNKSFDNSPRVPQRDKIKDALDIKELPWTEKQKRLIGIALDKKTKIIICKSPPGTGKTLISVYCSLKKLSDKKIGEIVYLRVPAESTSKSVGFLAGSLEDKLEKYCGPLTDVIKELLPASSFQQLINSKRISADSIGFIKGRTYSVCSVICDEAEDLSVQELNLLMCRMGKFSTLFIIGDERQSNIRNSGFSSVFEAFDNDEAKSYGIHTFEFTKEDCMRSQELKFILDTFEKLHFPKVV